MVLSTVESRRTILQGNLSAKPATKGRSMHKPRHDPQHNPRLNPLSRREVLKFGAFTTVGGVLTPGISLAQAIVTDAKGIVARNEQIDSGGTKIPIYHAGPEKMAKYPVIVVISGFTGNSEQN